MPNLPIDGLPAADALTGDEPVPVVQGGAAKQTTAADIAALAPAPTPSGLILVSTLTANNMLNRLEWTGLDDDNYLLILNALTPATNGADILLQFGTGGGPSWITASTYKYFADFWVESTNGTGNQSSAGAAGIQLGNAIDNSGGGLLQCNIQLFGLARAIRHMAIFDGARLNAGVLARIGGRGTIAGADALTAVRVITSAGNLLSGSGSLYRIAD